ncbi:MAG: hypothetical protein Q4C96_09830 [Planctomycetia bacterium]|nr:hypothetical protein [Planctomycetia bacterium]
MNRQKFKLFVGIFLIYLTIMPGCQSARQSWRRLFQRDAPRPAEAQLPEGASLEQIISVVNTNIGKVQSFKTNDATISGSGLIGTLRGEIAFSRPGNFRLRGSHGMAGAVIDVGRNQQVSWFWMQDNEPKGVYFCRNDQCASCPFMRQLPLDPTRMIDAMGFGILDPGLPYQGPYVIDQNHFALHLSEQSPSGQRHTRVILINRLRGIPAANRIYNHLDQLVMDASVKTYCTDPDTGLTVPQSIEINCPHLNNGKDLTVYINYGRFFLNTLDPNRTEIWNLPYQGHPPVDMMTL